MIHSTIFISLFILSLLILSVSKTFLEDASDLERTMLLSIIFLSILLAIISIANLATL